MYVTKTAMIWEKVKQQYLLKMDCFIVGCKELYMVKDWILSCIMNNEFMIYGEKVVVCPLNQSNVESYLSTYKKPLPFRKFMRQCQIFGKLHIGV